MLTLWLVMAAVAAGFNCLLDKRPSKSYRRDRYDGFRAYCVRASGPEIQFRLRTSSPAEYVRER